MRSLNELVFFESIENVKSLCEKIGARQPNTDHAQEISSSLAQGRLFLEASRSSPLEISPLILFYSQQAFARAIVLVRSSVRLAALPKSHGLTSAAPAQNRAQDLPSFSSRFTRDGTAARFNDVISRIQAMPVRGPGDRGNLNILCPTTESAALNGTTVTLKDVLARMSDLRDLYIQTFDEPPLAAGSSCPLFDEAQAPDAGTADLVTARISVRIEETYETLDQLQDIVRRTEESYPRLQNWRPIYANVSYGGTYLHYLNAARPDGDSISGQHFSPEAPDKNWRLPTANLANLAPRSLSDLAIPYAGLYEPERKAIVAPVGESDIAEQTLIYVGLYILSSIVRYHPNAWMRALRGGFAPNAPPNDKAIALIRQFLVEVSERLPGSIVGQLSTRL